MVSALNYNQPKILQQQQRHDLHKACQAAVPLRWTSKTVVFWLDLLEESAPVSDLFRRDQLIDLVTAVIAVDP